MKTIKDIRIEKTGNTYIVKEYAKNKNAKAIRVSYCKRILLKTNNEFEAQGAKMAATGELNIEALLK